MEPENQQQDPRAQDLPEEESNTENHASIGWSILGFLLFPVGLILYLLWRKKKPQIARKAGIGASIAFTLTAISGILAFIFLVAVPYVTTQAEKSAKPTVETTYVYESTTETSSQETKENTIESAEHETLSSIVANMNNQDTTPANASEVDSKNLTNDQLVRWIKSVLSNRGYKTDQAWSINILTGEDGLPTADVRQASEDQTHDTNIGSFRVNEKGQLEEVLLDATAIVVSEKYPFPN